jgi:hypothetical protein
MSLFDLAADEVRNLGDRIEEMIGSDQMASRFVLEKMKKNGPFYASYYRHVAKAEKVGERDMLFYGQYKRINNHFDGTELASSGMPEGQELQILDAVRDKCRRKSSPRPAPIRSVAIRKTCAPICGRR